MAADLFIQVADTRRLKFLARQRNRQTISCLYRQTDGSLKRFTGYKEYKINGQWYMEEVINFKHKNAKFPITAVREVLKPERYSFMDLIHGPRIQVGDTIDPSGFTMKVAKLFEGKVMVMLDRDFITKIQVYQEAVGDDSEWTVAENQKVIDFLEANIGKRIFAIFW